MSSPCTENPTVNLNCSGAVGSGSTNMTVPVLCSDGITTTNVTFSIPINDCNVAGTNVIASITCTCHPTNTFIRTLRDPSGFQLGMGVSPFGLIGINRIWSQNLTVGQRNNVCTITYNATGRCMNDLPSLVAMAYVQGARIQNDSWADMLDPQGLSGGMYTTDSQTYDTAVRDALLVGSPNTPGPSPQNQEFIVVFACNSGLGDAGSAGNAGGFGDIRVTAPSTAKNVISVASSENVRLDGSGCMVTIEQDNSLDIAFFSPAGPTLDGRFKPEIMAPGSSVWGAYDQLMLAVNNTNQCGIDNLVPTNGVIRCIDPIFGFTHVLFDQSSVHVQRGQQLCRARGFRRDPASVVVLPKPADERAGASAASAQSGHGQGVSLQLSPLSAGHQPANGSDGHAAFESRRAWAKWTCGGCLTGFLASFVMSPLRAPSTRR